MPCDVVRRYWLELWGGGDLSLVDELCGDPYTRHNRNGTQRFPRERLKADLARYFASLGRALEVSIDDMAQRDDRVWSRVTIRGIDGETGERRVVTFLHEARIEDGRMVESWSLTAPEIDWRPGTPG